MSPSETKLVRVLLNAQDRVDQLDVKSFQNLKRTAVHATVSNRKVRCWRNIFIERIAFNDITGNVAGRLGF